MTLHWSAAYVGLPFKEKGRDRGGVDCWGLVRLVYAGELGVELPGYDEGYASLAERDEIAGLMDVERSRPVWRLVNAATEFDVLVFRLGRLGTHVGIGCGGRRMLHVPVDAGACLEDFSGPRYASRLIGIYRFSGAGGIG